MENSFEWFISALINLECRHVLNEHRNKPHYTRCFQEVTFEVPLHDKKSKDSCVIKKNIPPLIQIHNRHNRNQLSEIHFQLKEKHLSESFLSRD